MKLDLHLHSFRSRDSINRPKTIVRMAEKTGVNFALTDHNSVRGWKETIVLGKKAGIEVIQGEEIMTFNEKGKIAGEIIGLYMNELIKPAFYLDVIDALREQDALISVPHPFDFLRNNFRFLKEEIKKVDCIEAFNSRCYSDSFNVQAKRFAELHSMPVTAGSDAHFPEEVGSAFLEIPKAFSLDDARKLIKKGKTVVQGKRSSVMVHVKTFFAKKGFFKAKNY